MKITIALLLAAAFMLSGCVLYTEDDSGNRVPMPNSDRLGVATLDFKENGNECASVDGPDPCFCMMCENKTPWSATLLPFLKPWIDSSLKGGKCTFEPCNVSNYYQSLLDKGDKLQNRVFMFGHGPSFVSTDSANLYCEYSLQLATKWMKGIGEPPKVPMVNRAKCWLDRNVMPVYIYYSAGQYIDETRTRQIAQALGGTGPVILTTEIDFDSLDASAVDAVKRQIVAYQDCDECLTLTALAVKSEDYNALELFFEDATIYPNGKNLSQMIDLVGFGFRANDYETCNIDNIIGSNYKFSREILKNYSKPTIWLYAGASEGNNTDGSCYYVPQKVHNFYQSIFSLSQAMASSGIIGVSFYEFIDRTGPLPCTAVEGCDFGVMSAAGQKHPEINTWSSLCTYFGTQDVRSGLVFSRNGKGPMCDFARNSKLYKKISSEIGSTKGLVYTPVIPMAKQDRLGCGEVCPSDTPFDADRYDKVSGFENFDPNHCDLYPEIEEYADDLDVSAIFMRGMFEQESDYNPFAISCNPAGSSACNVHNLPASELCRLAGNPPGCPSGFTCPAGQKPCAFGIAQCIDYPGKFYDENPQFSGEERTEFVGGCGGRSYNPFNPAMSACCGINVMRDNLDAAEAFVNSKWSILSACPPDGLVDGDKGWAIYFIAASHYFGNDAMGSLSEFVAHRDAGGTACSGTYKNFIDFLRNVKGYHYGAEVMSRYREAVDQCDSDCPR